MPDEKVYIFAYFYFFIYFFFVSNVINGMEPVERDKHEPQVKRSRRCPDLKVEIPSPPKSLHMEKITVLASFAPVVKGRQFSFETPPSVHDAARIAQQVRKRLEDANKTYEEWVRFEWTKHRRLEP